MFVECVVVRGRKVEEPRGEVFEALVGTPHHRGTGRIGCAPVGAHVPGVRCAGAVLDVGPGRSEAHAPAFRDQQGGCGHLPDDQDDDRRARGARPEESRLEPPQRRKHDPQQDRLGHLIERHAVERPADSIGPQQGARREESPQPRHATSGVPRRIPESIGAAWPEADTSRAILPAGGPELKGVCGWRNVRRADRDMDRVRIQSPGRASREIARGRLASRSRVASGRREHGTDPRVADACSRSNLPQSRVWCFEPKSLTIEPTTPGIAVET